MEPTAQLAIILPALTDLVEGIEPSHLHQPTPCARFDVRGVLDHMIGLGGTFAYLFRGEQPPEPTAPVENGGVPVAEFRTAMDDLLDAVRSDGAMARTVQSPLGAMPGETFARLVAFDGAVHGFDIARGIGRDFGLPDDVVTAVDGFARNALTEDLRDGDTFKHATTPPAGASPIERLAAFSGRTV